MGARSNNLAAMSLTRLTQLHVDDDGFVRAPAADCYRALSEVAAWATWWPGTRVGERGGKDTFRLRIGRGPWRIDLDVRAHGWRHERGFHLAVTGDLAGDIEFWLEPGWDGTVVHHLATLDGGSRGRHRRYRRWARRGLWGLKDRVQDAVLEAGIS